MDLIINTPMAKEADFNLLNGSFMDYLESISDHSEDELANLTQKYANFTQNVKPEMNLSDISDDELLYLTQTV